MKKVKYSILVMILFSLFPDMALALSLGTSIHYLSDFEGKTLDWTSFGGSEVGIDHAEAARGNSSLAITSPNGGDMYAQSSKLSSAIEVAPNSFYLVSLEVRATSVARSASITIGWLDSTRKLINYQSGISILDSVDKWKTLTSLVTAPQSARFALILPKFGLTRPHEKHLVDNVNFSSYSINWPNISNTKLNDFYTRIGTQDLILADTGQSWFLYPHSGLNTMSIINGKLSNQSIAGFDAGYAQVDLKQKINRIGAKVTFGPYTSLTGSFALVIWDSFDAGTGVPDSDFHLAVGPTGWNFGIWKNHQFTQIAASNFKVPLIADGKTIYTIDARIDGSTAIIKFPDHSVILIPNLPIEPTSTIGRFETFSKEAITDSKSSAVQIWADS